MYRLESMYHLGFFGSRTGLDDFMMALNFPAKNFNGPLKCPWMAVARQAHVPGIWELHMYLRSYFSRCLRLNVKEDDYHHQRRRTHF